MISDQHGTEERGPRIWPEPPTPFLAQPRAQSALRHELEAIVSEIKPSIERRRAASPDGTFELTVLPNRIIARLDDSAVSFSWVSGRLPTVADGCLLVIAWSNVASAGRGAAALKAATPTLERTYVAKGTGPDEWRWCAGVVGDEPRSSEHLTAEWLSRTSSACIA